MLIMDYIRTTVWYAQTVVQRNGRKEAMPILLVINIRDTSAQDVATGLKEVRTLDQNQKTNSSTLVEYDSDFVDADWKLGELDFMEYVQKCEDYLNVSE